MAKEFWITINGSLHNIGDVVEAEQIKYYGMGVDSQTDDLARLQVENARLREALAWYAEDMNYLVEKVVYDKHGLPWYAYVAEGDVQERARKALGGE